MRRAALLALSLLALASPIAAAPEILVKLGTRAPDGSTWHLILKEMGEQWREASGGRVVLRIYPNGVAGDEPDMVRAMRIGKLHAAAVTIVGLSLISPESQALSVPMLARNDAELDYVRGKLGPELEAKLAEKGFVVLNWGDAGWVQFFSTTAAPTPDEMSRLKFFVWTGDEATLDIWKQQGFRPVPLASTDILPSLQTGLIEAIPTTPLVAEAAQIFTIAKHMVKVDWAPLVGGTVIAAAKWQEIPEELRPKLMAIARATGDRLNAEVRRLDVAAVEAMKKRGLTVHVAGPAEEEKWLRLAQRGHPRVRGEVVPAAMFDRVKALTEEYRAEQAASIASPAAPSPEKLPAP
jgi:TRAP-type C4-dicarboxylate transport system substrate-binding protein